MNCKTEKDDKEIGGDEGRDTVAGRKMEETWVGKEEVEWQGRWREGQEGSVG